MAETTRPTWDQTFLVLAKETAKRSKDPSTKVGAVIVGPDHEVRSLGYNCFPRGVDDSRPGRLDRPLKYRWVEHAERNAVFNAARVGIPLKGCSMYVSWLPCSDCARAIIQSGIVALVVGDLSIPDRWRQDFLVSMPMLREAGVTIRQPDSQRMLEPFDILWAGRTVLRFGVETKVLWVRQHPASRQLLDVGVENELRSYASTPEELEASLVTAPE